MARRGYRRATTSPAGSGANRPSPGGGGGRRRPPGEPTEQDIARSIRQSAARVRVALQLGAEEGETSTLSDVVREFEATLDARRSAAVTEASHVRVELLECGLNNWQNLVELQRVVAGLQRPKGEEGEEQLLTGKTTLRHDPKYDEWTLALSFSRASEDSLWTFANALMLRLRSAGVFSRVLLPQRVLLPLMSACVEWDSDQLHFQWEGKSVWSQVVVYGVSEGRMNESQRVVMPSISGVPSSVSDPLPKLRNPDLVPLVDDMLSGNADNRKPIVVILRGIPGSGKSTLGREIGAICRHRGVSFTSCSADYFFETPRGYVFDVRKLGTAHSKCKGDFTRAIQRIGLRHDSFGASKQRGPRQHIVLVDNTSTQRWEYEPYEDIAKTHGSRVHIVEMECRDALTAFRMGQRNSHGVPPDKVVSMFMRWETDSRAHRFTPQFEHAPLSANPLSDGSVGGITYLGLFLDTDSQQKLLSRVPPAHSHTLADHVTLYYRPSKQYARAVELGMPFSVRGVEIVQDGFGQALRVELDGRLHLRVRNKIPHITLSTKDGVSASYSNELLENKEAKRTVMDPPMEFTAHAGAALFVQNQRVITTTSPFDEEATCCSSKVTWGNNALSDDATAQKTPKLFILYIDENDLIEETNAEGKVDNPLGAKLLLRAQIEHHMGSLCKSRRLLCVQSSKSSPTTTSAAMLDNLANGLLLSPTYQFDDMVVVPTVNPFQGFDDAMGRYQSNGGLEQITMLTTLQEPTQLPLRWSEYLKGTEINILYGGAKRDSVRDYCDLLTPACSTISSILDTLGVNIQERTRSAIVRGIGAVGSAWANVFETSVAAGRKEVRRIDGTLLGMNSSIVEVVVPLPRNTAPSEVTTLQLKLMDLIQVAGGVRHLVSACVPGQFYFQMCDVSNYSPLFCVRMILVDTHGDTATMTQLRVCDDHQLASHEVCNTEVYSVLTSLLRAILRHQCSMLLPSVCLLSSLLNLVSERLVLRYLQQVGSSDRRVSAEDVGSGHFIFAFYELLTQLSKLSQKEWSAAFGDSLLVLQGDTRARTMWSEAMKNVMLHCKTVIESYRSVMGNAKEASDFNAADHLDVIVSLMKTSDAGGTNELISATIVRAYIELPSRCQWSRLQSHALCDQLRVAAARAISQRNDERNADDTIFFHCTPSQVARRVEMASSSLELLSIVMDSVRTLERSEGGALPTGYSIHRAENDQVVSIEELTCAT